MVYKNALYLTGGQILNIASRVVYIYALAVLLGAEKYGSFSYAMACYMAVLPLVYSGVQEYLSREIGGASTNLDDLASATLALRIILSSFAALCLVFIGLSNPAYNLLFTLFSGALFFRAVSLWAAALFVAREKAEYWFYLERVFRPLEVLATVCIAYVFPEPIVVGFVHLGFWFFQAIVAYRVVVGRLGICINKTTFKDILLVLRNTLVISLVMAASVFLLQGQVVIAERVGVPSATVGQYALAVQFIGVLILIPQAVTNATLPSLARDLRHGGDKASEKLEMLTKGLILLIGLTAVAAESLSPLILLMFGDDYKEIDQFITTMLGQSIPYTIGLSLAQILIVQRKARISLFVSFVAIFLLFTNGINAGSPAFVKNMSIGSLSILLCWSLILGSLVYSGNWYRFVKVLLLPLSIAGSGFIIASLLKDYGILASLSISVGFLLLGYFLLGIITKADLKRLCKVSSV